MTPDETPEMHEEAVSVTSPRPSTQTETTPKESVRLVRGVAALAGIVALGAVLTAFVYMRSPEDAFVQKITSVIPYPAALVAWNPISMREYVIERKAVETYLASSNPGEELPVDLGSQILQTLINKQAIENLAAKHDLEATEEELDAKYQNAIGEMEESAFVAELKNALGWTPEEFKQRILRSVVLAEDVGAWVSADTNTQADPRARIDAAHARITGGEDFAVVAGMTSEDSTATSGGDIGFLSLSELPDAWRDQVMALEVGTFTPVVETDTAFIIFKSTDRVMGEAEDLQIRLSAIVIQKKTLEDAVAEYLESVKVRKLIRL